MPIKRLDKTRANLPEGYQYGDAAPRPCFAIDLRDHPIRIAVWNSNWRFRLVSDSDTAVTVHAEEI